MCEPLEELMKMPAKAFTVEELKFLINLDRYPASSFTISKEVENIYNRVKGLPMEQGGLEGGYQF